METVVIGHRNPDMDSICSALAYARLKQLLGVPNVIAGRAGSTNARIDYVLRKFNLEPPVFFSDVYPRVRDVMAREIVSVAAGSSVYEAIQLIDQKQLRGLPVTNESHQCLGLLSVHKLTQHLFPARDQAANTRRIIASLGSIVETIGGTVISGVLSRDQQEHLLMVAAMNADSFSERLGRYNAEQVVLLVGDREDIQMRAIEAGVRAIILTGGLRILNGVKAVAMKAGVVVIGSPHDTATTILLARGAVSAGSMVEPFTNFSPETLLDSAVKTVSASPSAIFPVLSDEGSLVGVLTKSDFIKPQGRQLILVDHNEMSQAVPGANTMPIVEILDHHRIGGFSSTAPVHFWNNPVGSTCTIVALCFEHAGVAIPPEIAGILMAGLISDTLNLTSPTTTATDNEMLKHLSRTAGLEADVLAQEIFSVGSPLLTLTPEQAVVADCKEYEVHGRRFSISQIEELGFSHLAGAKDALLAALASYCQSNGYFFAALLVTDVNTQNSLLLASGAVEVLDRIDFPKQKAHIWALDGIVSRKKQLLPHLMQCLPHPGKPSGHAAHFSRQEIPVMETLRTSHL